MTFWRLLCNFILIFPIFAKDYTGYRLVNIEIGSHKVARQLFDVRNEYSIDFLNLPTVNRTCQTVVKPDHVVPFLQLLNRNSISYSADEKDIQTLINENLAEESDADGFRAWRPFKDLKDIFVKFPRYTEIMRWMKQVASDYPQLVQIDTIGKTTDGKPTYALKLSTGNFGEKKVIWIDGAIHGREWISATTVLYVTHKLLTEYTAGHTDYLDEYDWLILPVANPDGYEFSHSTDRLWRKNRKHVVLGCYGVDLNRNFGVEWGVTKGSVSSQGCSDEYGGTEAFSEPETINMRNYMDKLKGRMEIYLSFHSYSQLWLVPWGYTEEKASDFKKMECVAEHAVHAARSVNGLKYRVGTLSDLLYPAAGGSFDWAKANGVPYAYTVELRPTAESVGDVFSRGFLATADEIEPAGEEIWAAITEMLNVINNGKCG